MKRFMMIAAGLLMLSGLSAQTIEQTPYVEVTAKASKEVAPDEIFVKIVLDESDNKGRTSITQLERDMFAAIRKVGIDEKNVEISDASSDLKTFLLRRNEGRTSKEYRVMVNNEQLSPLFIALDQAGIFNLSIESARYSKVAELRDELRVEAAKVAKMRAGLLAQAVGQELGKAILIQNYDNSPVLFKNVSLARAASADMALESVPTVDFQKISVESSVTIRFALP